MSFISLILKNPEIKKRVEKNSRRGDRPGKVTIFNVKKFYDVSLGCGREL